MRSPRPSWSFQPNVCCYRAALCWALAGVPGQALAVPLELQGLSAPEGWLIWTLVGFIALAVLALAGLGWSWALRRTLLHRNRALEESELRFRALVDHAPEAILLYDVEFGRVLDANPASERLFEMSRQQLLGVSLLALSPPHQSGEKSSRRLLEQLLQDSLREEGAVAEWVFQLHNGREFPAEIRLLRHPLGERRVVRATLIDITMRKRTEVALKAALESMTMAHEQAAEANRVKDNFLSLITHELLTPLTSMRLQLDRLRRDKEVFVQPRLMSMVEKVRHSALRMTDLVESILEYTRVEGGRLHPDPRPFQLAALAAGVLEELKGQAEAKGLGLALKAPPQLAPLVSDPRLIRLVLSNLLVNAIKFTARGQVTVEVEQDERVQLVRVRDTGCGIPLPQQDRVFDRFVHIEPISGKHTPGLGLGLPLSRELVSALGGELHLHSVEGEGSTFTVRLPRREVSPLRVPAEQAESQAATGSA